MPLTEQTLADDLTRAMKAREMSRVYVLRGLLTAVKLLKVEKRLASLPEADLVQLVRREMRQREEAGEFASKGGRTDAVEQNRVEREILAAYAPALLDERELELTIRALAHAPGQSLGGIMAALRAQYAGRFDGRTASDIARRVLAEGAQA